MSQNEFQKLEKVGEYGFGKHALFLFSSINKKTYVRDLTFLGKSWKTHFLHVNLSEPIAELDEKFVNTCNYYDYAKTILVDYFSFILLLRNIERLKISLTEFESIVIFNPVLSSFFTPTHFLLKPQKYTTLSGETILPQKNIIKAFTYDMSKLQFLKSQSVFVIGFDDTKSAFALSSKIKNVTYFSIHTYDELFEFIPQRLRSI